MRWLFGMLAAGCLAGCGPTITFAPGEGGGGGSSSSTETSTSETSAEATTTTTAGQGGATTTTGTQTTTTVTTSGHGGATTSTSVTTTGPTTITVSASTSGAGGGMQCYTCSEAIQGSGPPLCMQSQIIFDALYQCACQNSCPMECYNACNFGMGDPNCDQCIFGLCWAELDACYNDF